MPKDIKCILGISPGTRTFGFALIQNGTLIDWGVWAFNQKWSADKLQQILYRLELLIRANQVEILVCKTVHPSRSSKDLNELLAGIMEQCRKTCTERVFLTLEEIGETLINQKKATKKLILEFLLSKYSEIIPYVRKERTNKRPYYVKLFEAIAAAECVSMKKSP